MEINIHVSFQDVTEIVYCIQMSGADIAVALILARTLLSSSLLFVHDVINVYDLLKIDFRYKPAVWKKPQFY